MLKIPIFTPGEFINVKWLSKNYWWWGNYYTIDASVATVCDHKHSVSLLVSEKEADTAPARGQDWAPGRGTGMHFTTPSSPCPPWKPRQGLSHWGLSRHLLEGVEFSGGMGEWWEDTESFHNLHGHMFPEFKAFLFFGLLTCTATLTWSGTVIPKSNLARKQIVQFCHVIKMLLVNLFLTMPLWLHKLLKYFSHRPAKSARF